MAEAYPPRVREKEGRREGERGRRREEVHVGREEGGREKRGRENYMYEGRIA